MEFNEFIPCVWNPMIFKDTLQFISWLSCFPINVTLFFTSSILVLYIPYYMRGINIRKNHEDKLLRILNLAFIIQTI